MLQVSGTTVLVAAIKGNFIEEMAALKLGPRGEKLI